MNKWREKEERKEREQSSSELKKPGLPEGMVLVDNSYVHANMTLCIHSLEFMGQS